MLWLSAGWLRLIVVCVIFNGCVSCVSFVNGCVSLWCVCLSLRGQHVVLRLLFGEHVAVRFLDWGSSLDRSDVGLSLASDAVEAHDRAEYHDKQYDGGGHEASELVSGVTHLCSNGTDADRIDVGL